MDPLSRRIADMFLDGKITELANLFAPDALLDINVPQWRFQVAGRDAASVLDPAADPDNAGMTDRVLVNSRVTALEDGVAVESANTVTEDGETRLWRDIHLFHHDGEHIVELTSYCTGIWDAATIARQAVEAPMLRP